MEKVVEIGLFIILSGVKYLFAVIPLLAGSQRAWYLDMLIVTTGGLLGVFIFTYLGAFISSRLSKYHFFRFKYPKLKRFVRIKNSYGLIGIAILSPVLFSIPVGCIISTAFEHDKLKIIRYQAVSVVVWSIVLFGLKGIFGINLGEKLHE